MSKRYKKARKRERRIHSGTTDFHHFCFQRRHWQQGYAQALRNHWYMGAYIPIALHRELHSKIHDVPVPNGVDCKRAYEELQRRERLGLIYQEDPPQERLNFLIEMFEEICPATTAIFEWQKQVISKYYKKPP